MDVNLMRLAWSFVDETPIPRRANLSLGDSPSERLGQRINAILQSVETHATLSIHERQQIQRYLMDRKHLITALYQ